MPEDTPETGKEIADLIREKHNQMTKGDFFALLDIDQDADNNAVRTAYFQLAKLLHPDVVARKKLEGIERQALVVFKGISEAYQILSDRRRRAEYVAKLAAGRTNEKPHEERRRRDNTSEARIFFHKGTLLAQRRVWPEADACFRKAVDLDPNNVCHLVSLGWAVMQNEEVPELRRMDEAREWFLKAVTLNAHDADAHYHLAMYFKAKDDKTNQRKSLYETLQLDSKHVGAKREIRLLEMRSRRANDMDFKDIFNKIKEMIAKLKK